MRLLVYVLALAACTSTAPPTPTETVCPDPDPDTLTWDNFGQKFMTDYCTMCHSSTLSRTQRNGAPYAHDYDTLKSVLYIPDHIDADAGSGPAACACCALPEHAGRLARSQLRETHRRGA